jgi:hypothetical protein
MRQDFLDRFPKSHQALVAEIEKATGFEIEVLTVSERSVKYGIPYAAGNDDFPGVMSDHRSIRLEIPDGHTLTDDEMLHELLHLDRFYIQRAPKLLTSDRANLGYVTGVDNPIEHNFFFRKGESMSETFADGEKSIDMNFWAKWPPKASVGLAAIIDATNMLAKAKSHYPDLVSGMEAKLALHIDPGELIATADRMAAASDKVDYARLLFSPFPDYFKKTLLLCDAPSNRVSPLY